MFGKFVMAMTITGVLMASSNNSVGTLMQAIQIRSQESSSAQTGLKTAVEILDKEGVFKLMAELEGSELTLFKARQNALKKANLANMKVLAGAIEMYKIDTNTRLEAKSVKDLEVLVQQKYLKTVPETPGFPGEDLYRIDKNGNIWNEIFGSLDGSCHGEIAKECKESMAKIESRKKASIANMRTLAGALEMYSLDHGDRPLILRTEKDIEVLKSSHYLKEVPQSHGCKNPDGCYRSDRHFRVWDLRSGLSSE